MFGILPPAGKDKIIDTKFSQTFNAVIFDLLFCCFLVKRLLTFRFAVQAAVNLGANKVELLFVFLNLQCQFNIIFFETVCRDYDEKVIAIKLNLFQVVLCFEIWSSYTRKIPQLDIRVT